MEVELTVGRRRWHDTRSLANSYPMKSCVCKRFKFTHNIRSRKFFQIGKFIFIEISLSRVQLV
jgi:hypothetical protein